jgi:hypothetical protein
MRYYLRSERMGRYAEIRPYDGAWTMLATCREHATPFKTFEEALDAIPAVVEACADGWRITAPDLYVVRVGEPTEHVEQYDAYVRRVVA